MVDLRGGVKAATGKRIGGRDLVDGAGPVLAQSVRLGSDAVEVFAGVAAPEVVDLHLEPRVDGGPGAVCREVARIAAVADALGDDRCRVGHGVVEADEDS